MTRRIPLLLLVLFLVIGTAFSQSYTADSLLQLINKSGSDSLRLYYEKEYAKKISIGEFKKAIDILERVKTEAKNKNWIPLQASATQAQSALYFRKGDYINSILYDEETEKICRTMTDSIQRITGVANTLINLGGTYSLLNDLENAQLNYTKGIDILEKLKDSTSLLTAYFNMAFIYIDILEWNKAKTYLAKSVTYAPGTLNYEQRLLSTARAAAVSFKLKQQADGIRYLRDAGILLKDSTALSIIYYHNASAEYYYFKKQLPESLTEHQKAYDHAKNYGDPYYIVDEAAAIGQIYLETNRIDSSEHYLNIAMDTGRKYNYLPKLRLLLNEWSDYYEKKGNFKKAYELRTQQQLLTDSIIGIQNHNRILLYDARYQSEKKENMIRQLEQESKIQELSLQQKNIINYLLIAAAIVLFIIITLGYRNYRQKQKMHAQQINELEIEKKLTATEAVLKGEEQERTRLAKDLHDGLGGMLSGIKYTFQSLQGKDLQSSENQQSLSRGMEMLDQSIHEMRRLAHNMMPEVLLRYGLNTAISELCQQINKTGAIKLTYDSIGIEGMEIPQTTSITIFRIVQELLNNILKHSGASTAYVQLGKNENHLSITVEDDGKGFNTDTLINAQGIGWSNIQNRVEFLTGKLHVSSSEGKGCSVLIEFSL